MRGTPQDRVSAPRQRWVVTGIRCAVAVGLSAALGMLLWSRRPESLTAPIDVVGFPTFVNFNYHDIFWAWRIVIWVIPLLSITLYVVLARVGPLRDERTGQRQPLPRIPAHPAALSRACGIRELRWGAMLLVPAVLVAYAVSAIPLTLASGFTTAGLLAGVAYAAVVAAVAMVVREVRRRRGADVSSGQALALTSALLGVLLGPAVLYVASRRTLAVTGADTSTSWSWFPLWLALLTIAGGVALVARQLVRGQGPFAIERRVRTLLLGSVAVFVAMISLPGVIGWFQGFDDAQSVVGADLLSRGYLPWRDFMFIHGLFEDALRSSVGFGLFEHSLWGAAAARSMVFVPLFWVLTYLLGAWAAPRGSIAPVMVVILAAAWWLPISERWVALAAGLLLLGEAVRRQRWEWTALLTAFLFVQAVLVPEASFQVIASFLVLLLSDIAHRPAGASWWRCLPTVRIFVTTGAALTALLVVVLALAGALEAFVDYYRYFAPGHNESGTLPLDLNPSSFDRWAIAVMAAMVIVTFVFVAWRWAHGRGLSALHWCMLGSAILAGLYGEKALGRFDGGHVGQSVTVALPLFVMWVGLLTGELDARVRSWLDNPGRTWPRLVRRGLVQPFACVVLLGLVLTLPDAWDRASQAPSRTKVFVGETPPVPKVGYVDPNGWNQTLLQDIEKVVDTYAGEDGEVFDFTNSPGYFYYLLGRDMPTPFVHISLAVTEAAQDLVVDRLKKSQPPLVVFDNTTFGLAAWDGPRPGVRHFEVAEYLLDHYTPVLAADGVLFMLRDDLVADRPAPPVLSAEPDTTDLYFSQPACDWGYSANYLESPPEGPHVELPVSQQGGFAIQLSGWTYDFEAGQTVPRVVVTVGRRVVGDLTPDAPRPDVAAASGVPGSEHSGFGGAMAFLAPVDAAIQVYAVLADGTAYVLSPQPGFEPPASLRDGDSTIEVAPLGRNVGVLDALDGRPIEVTAVTAPPSVDLADYELATFEADGPIGSARFAVVDELGATSAYGLNRQIDVGVLPSAGDSISVRVGSCLQWHGYQGRQLFLTQEVGAPKITRVVLSDVRD